MCGARPDRDRDRRRRLLSDGGLRVDHRRQHNIAVIWVIFNDGEYKLIKLSQLSIYKETALVSFDNPDYVAIAHACGADGYAVDTQHGFEKALAGALAS